MFVSHEGEHRRGAPEEAALQWSVSSLTGRLILAATILASGLAFLFGSAVTIALPAIQAEFGATFSGIQWIVNSFTLVLGVFILLSGALSDRYGRKLIFATGISVFTVGLFLSGLAPSLGWLIAFQTLSGLGAAMAVPSSLAIVRTCFYKAELGRAIGLWAGFATGIAALGPLVGGVLVDVWGWRAIFFSLIPLALLILAAVIRFVPETKSEDAGVLDVGGAGALFAALLGILFALIQGPLLGWTHPLVLISIALGVLFSVLFVIIERRVPHPIVPFSIFRSPLVVGANAVTLFLYLVLGGTIFFVTLNLQQIQDLSPLSAGLALLPPIVIIALFSGLSGRYADTVGARTPMVVGSLLVSFSMALLFFTDTDTPYFLFFFPALIALGAGMTLVIPALTKSALAVSDEYAGVASGVNNAVSRVAWLLAVATLGVVATAIFSVVLNRELSALNLPPALEYEVIAQEGRLGGIVIQSKYDAHVREQAEGAVERAFVSGFRAVVAVNFVLAIFASLLAWYFVTPTGSHTKRSIGKT